MLSISQAIVLNLIHRTVLERDKEVVGDKKLENKGDLKEQLTSAFQQDFVKIPIYDYLRT
jgi:hypothetical protein